MIAVLHSTEMIRSYLFPLCLAAFAFFIAPVWAWDPLGHMLTAQIAYDRLTPAAKTHIDEAIARFNAKDKPDTGYDFVTAACWMDDIRARPEMKAYAPWHYVNMPYTPDGLPIPDASVGPNVINGLEKAVAIVSGQAVDPAIDQDQALMILIHLTGDIHQPLHATSRNDDLGGNRVKVSNLKDPLADLVFGKGGNLHFFWDSAYRRVYKNGEASVAFEPALYDRNKPVAGHQETLALVRAQATALQKKYPPATFKEQQGDPLTWAKESHSIGYTLGYSKLPAVNGDRPIRLQQGYTEAASIAAEKRIVLAGYRMANMLNKFYEKSAPTPTPTSTSKPESEQESKPVLQTPAVESPAL